MPKMRQKRNAAREAFESEAMVHLDGLYAAALRLTKAPSDAEDLVQDTLVRAYRFYDRFEAGTNFRAWLFKIQTNTFINRYRRAVRERDVLEGKAAKPVGEGVMSRAAMLSLTDPVGVAQRALVAQEIQRALERLPDESRLMIMLADVEGLSYREIADVVNCPIGTVMSRLHRARKTLQTELVAHAIELGIVTNLNEEPSDAVSLEAYRKRRGAKS